jgi:hypothetical protein
MKSLKSLKNLKSLKSRKNRKKYFIQILFLNIFLVLFFSEPLCASPSFEIATIEPARAFESESEPESEFEPELYHQVELIVFKNKNPEKFSEKIGVIDTVYLERCDEEKPLPEFLDEAMWQLTEHHQKLFYHKEYEILYHKRWKTVLNDKTIVYLKNEDHGFEGTVSSYEKNSRMHISADLSLKSDSKSHLKSVLNSLKQEKFKLIESRIIKNQELNYFDHPYFGALMICSLSGM